MRASKVALVALAAAASLTLTACNGDNSAGAASSSSGSSGGSGGGSSAASSSSSSSSASSSAPAQGAAKKATGTSGGVQAAAGSAGGSRCRTPQLKITANGGMADHSLVINFTNTGSTTCTLVGFPGIDAVGKDGRVSASRTSDSTKAVTLKPGGFTAAELGWTANTSGGSGVTYNKLIVTPPNSKASRTISVPAINMAADNPDHASKNQLVIGPVGFKS